MYHWNREVTNAGLLQDQNDLVLKHGRFIEEFLSKTTCYSNSVTRVTLYFL